MQSRIDSKKIANSFSLSHITTFMKPTTLIKTWLQLLLLLSLSLVISCEQSSDRKTALIDIHIKQANAYLKSGQYRAAAIEARNVIQKSPESNQGFLLLAKVLLELGQHKNALTILEKAPSNTTQDSTFIFTQAKAFIGRQKHQSALTLLNEHANLENTHPLEYKRLKAQTHTSINDLQTAKGIYNELLALDNNNTDAFTGLAEIAIKEKDFEQANNYLAELDALAPQLAETGILKAKISLISLDLESAENHLSDTLTKLKSADIITPQKATILKILSEVLVKQGRSAEALIYTRLLADAFPGYEVAEEQYTQAAKDFEAGNLGNAEKTLEELLQNYPNHENASLMLAIIKYRKGDFETAATHLNANVDPELAHPEITRLAALTNLRNNQPNRVIQLLKSHPGTQEDAKLLTIYGAAALAKKDNEEGLKALEKAIKINPSSIESYIELANFYNQSANIKKATAYLQTAYQIENNITVATLLTRNLVNSQLSTEAKKIVTQQLKKRNEDTASLNLAGDFYSANNDFTTAANYYERVIEKDNQNYLAALKLAELSSLSKAAFNDTLKTFSRAIVMQPQNTTAYERLLNIAIKEQQLTPAENHINKLANQLNDTTGYAVLAIFFAEEEDSDRAEQYLERIDNNSINKLLSNNSHFRVYYAKALSLLKEEKLTLAKEQVFAALRIKPKSTRLLSLLTEIEIAGENYTEAEKLANQIASLNQNLSHQLSGGIAEAQGNIASAIEQYDKVWQNTPSEPLAVRLYSLLQKSSPQEAKTFLQEWLSKNPNSISALAAKSRDLLLAQQFKTAIPLMEKVRELEPNNTTNLNNLAWALQQINDTDAVSIASQAYNLESNNANIADTYGWILYQNGQRSKALTILSKAASLAPDNAEIAQHLETAKKGR